RRLPLRSTSIAADRESGPAQRVLARATADNDASPADEGRRTGWPRQDHRTRGNDLDLRSASVELHFNLIGCFNPQPPAPAAADDHRARRVRTSLKALQGEIGTRLEHDG